jgi:hypothetical protein
VLFDVCVCVCVCISVRVSTNSRVNCGINTVGIAGGLKYPLSLILLTLIAFSAQEKTSNLHFNETASSTSGVSAIKLFTAVINTAVFDVRRCRVTSTLV